MTEAVTAADPGLSQPLLAKRASRRWIIAATLITAIVALPVLSVIFLAFFPEENILSSPEAQRIYAEANTEYPANPEVKPSGLVAQWGEIKPDQLSLQTIAENREAAVKLVDRVDYDGK